MFWKTCRFLVEKNLCEPKNSDFQKFHQYLNFLFYLIVELHYFPSSQQPAQILIRRRKHYESRESRAMKQSRIALSF